MLMEAIALWLMTEWLDCMSLFSLHNCSSCWLAAEWFNHQAGEFDDLAVQPHDHRYRIMRYCSHSLGTVAC